MNQNFEKILGDTWCGPPLPLYASMCMGVLYLKFFFSILQTAVFKKFFMPFHEKHKLYKNMIDKTQHTMIMVEMKTRQFKYFKIQNY